MKKLLIILVLIAMFAVGYLLGSGNTDNIPGEDNFRDIRTAASVRTGLALNKHLDGSKIEVDVTGGTLVLTGWVGSADHRQLAEAIAGGVAPEYAVRNLLDVDPGLLPPPGAPADRSLGQRLDDLTTAARIRTILTLHRDVDQGDVSVTVVNGVATVKGTVATWAVRELIGKVVEDVEGVREVRNELQVDAATVLSGGAPPAPSPPAEAPDGAATSDSVRQRMTDGSIRLQVQAALNVNPFIDARRIQVDVQQGHVTLRGAVPSDADRDLVQKIAEDCWGVSGVSNEVEVTSPPPAAAPARAP